MDKNKLKKKGTMIAATASIFIALALGVAALFLGALNKNNWHEANKNIRLKQGMHAQPLEKSITLLADGVTCLDIDQSGGKVIVSSYDGDEISIKYFEDFEGETIAKIEKGVLKIEREWLSMGLMSLNCDGDFYYSLGLDWWLYKDKNVVQVMLPRSLSFLSSKIKVSGGVTDISNVSLGRVSKCKVSGGKIYLDNCSAQGFDEIEVSGGLLTFDDCTMGNVDKISVSGGAAKFYECNAYGKAKIKVSGGLIRFAGGAQWQDLNISVSGGFIEFAKFAYSVPNIGFDVSKSGGSVTLNGKDINQGLSGNLKGDCFISANISGGRLKIST